MNRTPRWMRGYIASIAIVAIIGALLAAGCGGGKSSADKTATAAAKAGAATATKPAVTSTAAATATKAPAATATNAPAATNTPGAATPTLKIGQVASIGSVLTNPAGLTLYTYKDDVPNSGQSSVPAAIAPNWPPLTVTGSPVATSGLPGQLGSFTRPDGSKQVMYNGMPLYTFVGDTQPGQANGQGLLNLWFAATP
jgi:predicted lipoprotein with Yx(FWY)xxD motif